MYICVTFLWYCMLYFYANGCTNHHSNSNSHYFTLSFKSGNISYVMRLRMSVSQRPFFKFRFFCKTNQIPLLMVHIFAVSAFWSTGQNPVGGYQAINNRPNQGIVVFILVRTYALRTNRRNAESSPLNSMKGSVKYRAEKTYTTCVVYVVDRCALFCKTIEHLHPIHINTDIHTHT